MRNDWRIFGMTVNIIAVAFYAVAFLLVALLVMLMAAWFWQQAPMNHPHTGHHGSCPTSDIPKAERQHGVTECRVGSPVTFRKGTSRVEDASRTDSRLSIHGIYKESMGIARGCGRKWTVVDTYRFPGAGASRDTKCNLKGHTTARKNRFGNWVRDSEWAKHPR